MMAHDALGCLFLELNLNEQAARHFEQGLRLGRDAGIIYWLPRLQANLVIARLRLGIACDLTALQAAAKYSHEHSEAWLTLRCLEALAELALVNGDAQGCIVHADQLMALASGGDMRELVGHAHRLRGLAWLAVKDYEPARTELMRALTLAEQLGRIRLEWECHLSLARIEVALGEGDNGSAHRASADGLAARIADSLRGSGLASNWEAHQ